MAQFKNLIVRSGDALVSQILFNEENWRIHTREQMEALQGSFQDVGTVKRVLINLRTSPEWGDRANIETLVDGHARAVLFSKNDMETIPADYVDLTPREEAIILTSLDPITGMATSDREKLATLLRDRVETDNENLKALYESMTTKERLDEFYNSGTVEEDEPRLDEADRILEEWKVESGQIWEIPSSAVTDGVHRILCGDSTDPNNLKRLMGEDRARLIWTDPPYGTKTVGTAEEDDPHHSTTRNIRPITNDDLSSDDLCRLIHTAIKNCDAVTLPGAGVYMASPSGNMLPALIDSFTDSGFDFHWLLVWYKDSIVLSRADYHMRHENILYGWKPGGKHYFTSDRTQSSVFEYPRPKISELHPTMKPVGLVAHQIKNSARESEIVLDPFCGSGTTMAACERTRRLCRAMEIEPIYVAVTLQRMFDLGLRPKLLK